MSKKTYVLATRMRREDGVMLAPGDEMPMDPKVAEQYLQSGTLIDPDSPGAALRIANAANDAGRLKSELAALQQKLQATDAALMSAQQKAGAETAAAADALKVAQAETAAAAERAEKAEAEVAKLQKAGGNK